MGNGLKRVAKQCGGLIAKSGDLSVRYDAEGRPVGTAVKTVDLRVGESVTIAPGIRVKYVELRHFHSRGLAAAVLGVDAPQHVAIDREEIRASKERGYRQ